MTDIKLAPQRIYTIAFHPTETKPVVFAGDKEGNVSVFDASQAGPKHGWDEVVEEEDEDDSGYIEPTVHTFQPHVRPVSSFALPFNNPNALLSSSYDGSIRMLDLDKLTSVFVAGLGDDDDLGGRDSSISAIDVHADEPNLVWFTTQGAVLACHDMRTKLGGGGRKSKPVRSWVVGSTKVGGFGLHPLRAHLAATASNDRTMRVWDLRATVRGFFDDKDVPVDECSLSPGMLGMHESGYSVITATWSAGGAVATTCYDDHLRLFDLSKDVDKWKYTTELGSKPHYMDPDLPQIEPTRAIRHSCQTGRWVTQLKPAWQRRPQDGVQKLVVGNMDRFVDVFAESGERIAQLGGETDPVTGRQLISAVPAAAALHPSMNWVAGGTASGKLTLWM